MKFKSLRRFVSTLSASMLMLGMLTFVPGAFASTMNISSQTPAIFDYNKDGSVSFTVKMTDNDNKLVGVDFSIRNTDGQIQLLNLIASHDYFGNTDYEFSWDGKINGVYVDPGNYQAVFEGGGKTISSEIFHVNSSSPTLAFDPTPADTHVISSGDYKFSVSMANWASNTTVTAYLLDKDGAIPIPKDDAFYQGNVTKEFAIDMSDAVPFKTYVVRLYGEDTKGNITNTISHDVQALPQLQVLKGQLDWDPTPASQYVLGTGDYDVSVALTKATSITSVTAKITNAQNESVSFVSSMDNNVTHTFSFDTANWEVGHYSIDVTGKDQNNIATNTLHREFDVISPNNNDSCVGYQDVSKNSSSCAALTWLKQKGIMEGEGDGTFFNPKGEFNRAAATKVALVAYGKYNANLDYCNGKDPFPDTDRKLWYGNYICRANSLQVVTGYSAGPDAGNFVPGRAVSVIEMFAILLRPLNEIFAFGPSYTGLESDQWYSPYAKYSRDNALYPGNTLSPTKIASREEVALYVYALYLNGEL